jgi:hypothetical protein
MAACALIKFSLYWTCAVHCAQIQVAGPGALRPGPWLFLGVQVIPMNLEARVTGVQAAAGVRVSRQLVHYWHTSGVLKRGADGLYRYGDVLAAERDMRRSSRSRRLAA